MQMIKQLYVLQFLSKKHVFGLILTGISGRTGLHNIRSPGNIWFPSKCPPPQNFQSAQNIWLPAGYTFSQHLRLKLQRTAVAPSVLVQKICFLAPFSRRVRPSTLPEPQNMSGRVFTNLYPAAASILKKKIHRMCISGPN